MDKNIIYKNIRNFIENGFFFNKYVELTEDITLDESKENYYETLEHLEQISAQIFNSILIGCQLFEEEEKIIEFVNNTCTYLDSICLEYVLHKFGMTEEEACEKLKKGFAVHFTTTKICEKIINENKIYGYGKNMMFTEEEKELIKLASKKQKENDPEAEIKMNYLFTGWGAGVSSYSSITNGFWMYHTPESLSFLFGNISNRNKEEAMKHVMYCTSTLDEYLKQKTLTTLNKMWDKLVGEDQNIGCILIDRNAFEYEVDFYYDTGSPVAVERRPYSHGLNSLDSNDNKINCDIDIEYLKFLKIPTIKKLENEKQQILNKGKSK